MTNAESGADQVTVTAPPPKAFASLMAACSAVATDAVVSVTPPKLGVIGFYSLASGFLTGKYRSRADTAGRARGSRVEKYLNEYGFGVLAALDEVAKRYEAKPGQIAVAWLIARPSVKAPRWITTRWRSGRPCWVQAA